MARPAAFGFGAAYAARQHVPPSSTGTRARIRTNHLAFHGALGRAAHGALATPLYSIGFDAMRTEAGWRLTRGGADVIWRAGLDR